MNIDGLCGNMVNLLISRVTIAYHDLTQFNRLWDQLTHVKQCPEMIIKEGLWSHDKNSPKHVNSDAIKTLISIN